MFDSHRTLKTLILEKSILLVFILFSLSMSAQDFKDSLSVSCFSSAQTEKCAEPSYNRAECRLGTNILYDAATVANLSLEIGFAHRIALNLSSTFSPWDIRPDHKFRTLLLQPELRCYLSKGFKGHYLGVEGHYGWYNIAICNMDRYQDKDGSTPLWGAGLSYGYVVSFNKHLGMDFSVSAGYAELVYDCFYNIENGAKFTTITREWWGPTRIGMSIYYQF